MKMKETFAWLKERTTSRHIYSVLTMLLATATIFSLVQVKRANDYKLQVQNQYNRSFHEMVDYVRNIDMSLSKGLLVSDPRQLVLLSNDIWRSASSAQANLGQLPISQFELENTQKFLAQVGDYCYMLSKKAASQEKLTEDEYTQMAELDTYATSLHDSLVNIQSELYDGTIKFSDLENSSSKIASANATEGFGSQIQAVEQEFQDYPSLIYDGPFSSHLENMEPAYIKNMPDVSEEDAKKKVNDFFGQEKTMDLKVESGNSGIIQTYSFSSNGANKNEEIMIDVTKKGGVVLWMTDNRAIDLSNEISMDDAIKKAKDFLTRNGYPDMKSSYYQKTDGSAVINFAYTKNGAIYYPDLIKVKIALDNGDVVGFEARGFIMRHNENRKINSIKISRQEAQSKLNKKLIVENCQMALIPLENMQEVLCYEFKGKSNNKDFIVYVNAETGKEENILILLETPEGILTM